MNVTTKSALEKAVKRKEREIHIMGDLADKVHNGKKIVTLGKVTLGAVGTAIAALPFTGGVSAAALAPIAAMSGLEIAAVIAICFVGIALLIAVWNNYSEVEFSSGDLKLRLKK